jgi:hypothetical protein
MLKRRLKLLGKILLALIVLLVVFLLFERFRGQISLARYKRELAAKGEKLTPQDLATPFFVDDNGAPAVMKNIGLLQDGEVLPKHYPPRMKLTQTGRAIVCFKEDEWVDDKVTNRWEQVALDLKTNESPLAQIRAGLLKPILNNQLDFTAGLKMTFTNLVPAKACSFWFGAAIQLALHEGRTREALTNLRAQIELPRLLADDHLAISELVRIAVAAIARTDTWEALQSDGWTDEDLATLQRAWADQAFAKNMVRSLEGERVYIAVTCEQLRASNEESYEMMFGQYSDLFADGELEDSGWLDMLKQLPLGEGLIVTLRKQVYCRLWRFAWSFQAELRTLKHLQRLIELMRSGDSQSSYLSIRDDLDVLLLEAATKNTYGRLRYPPPESVITLSFTLKKAMRAETERSLLLSAVALQRHKLRHGNYPESLSALVPEFLPAVPVDYMNGKPIKYHRNDDGSYTLYSVGEDGRDDGGDSSPVPDAESPRDLWRRRDFVWPAPATPEEVETYRREASKN